MSDETIKKTSEVIFKKLVKKQTTFAALKYLKLKQSKGIKAATIKYNTIELQDYLGSYSNLKLEDQRYIFNFRSEMNQIKSNFQRDTNIKEQYCITDCMQVLDNEHITWCKYLNEANDYRYSNILNGDLNEKLETLKQIQSNNRKREEDSSTL